MSGLVGELRRHHDRLECRIEEISGTRFKTDSERDAEIELAMSLCWKAADEIDRLTARVAELEGVLKSSRCPRPAQGRPDDLTVADCMTCLECGCEFGAVLGRNAP